MFYPVGIIIHCETCPAETIGGTWEQIKDVFLLASGDTYESGATGGSADATVVAHEHSVTMAGSNLYNINSTATKGNGWYISTTDASVASGESSRIRTDENGECGAGKNMPPYIAVNTWKRIA